MCALCALVMTELKCAFVMSILLIGIELQVRNCCFVCSINDGQFALLPFVCVIWCGVGVRHVRVVIMIGTWSEGTVWTVHHVVFCSNVGEQKVISGEDV